MTTTTAAAAPDPDEGRLIDLTTLARWLGVEPRHVRRLVAERRIPFIKWGHLLRFDPAEIRRWIDGYRRHPGRPA